jgi:hypothetical protein
LRRGVVYGLPPVVAERLGKVKGDWREPLVPVDNGFRIAWHQAQGSTGLTEAKNNLIKVIKRVGCGFRRVRNYRLRFLLYTGRPNWDLLVTLTPISHLLAP